MLHNAPCSGVEATIVGAKCTGEVCKILQDPACPPSHQFLATYWYLAYNWCADADTQCVCENIGFDTLDAIAQRYLLDETMQHWFKENNPYALEESSRRFLEMNTRGKWNGNSEVLNRLRCAYLQAEGDLEDNISGRGEIQAGNVDIIAHDQIEGWAKRIAETEGIIKKWQK